MYEVTIIHNQLHYASVLSLFYPFLFRTRSSVNLLNDSLCVWMSKDKLEMSFRYSLRVEEGRTKEARRDILGSE